MEGLYELLYKKGFEQYLGRSKGYKSASHYCLSFQLEILECDLAVR